MREKDGLERFRMAQDSGYEGYLKALEEIRRGRKTGHWMWYIFPQMKGLGRSQMSEYYGIDSIGEARAYLQDPVLGRRLEEICEALLVLEDKDAQRIFGWTDQMKLRSGMTLFGEAAGPGSVFERVLEEYFGGARDGKTLRLLGKN